MNSRQAELLALINNSLDQEENQTDAEGMREFMEEIGESLGRRYKALKEKLENGEPPTIPDANLVPEGT